MVSVLDFKSSIPGLTPGQVTVFCSQARHFTLIVCMLQVKFDFRLK